MDLYVVQKLRPALLELPPALADAGVEMFTHAVGDEKLGVFRPAIAALRQTNLFDAERFAMRGAGIVLMGRAVADVAVDDDQGWHVVGASEGFDRLCEPLGVIGVADALHVPAIGKEARGHVVAEGEIRVAFDRDAVAVVNPAEVSEHQVTRERGGFARDAFHHVAVTAERINVVVEHLEAGLIEALRQPTLGDRHADAHPTALTQGPSRRLDARGAMIFGVAWTFTIQLAEALDVVESDCEFGAAPLIGLYASKMQHRIEQHRGVSVGQHEAVAIWPSRIIRIKAQKALPQRVNDRRQGHRGARMAGLGLLHSVHGQRTDRIDAQFVDGSIARRRASYSYLRHCS